MTPEQFDTHNQSVIAGMANNDELSSLSRDWFLRASECEYSYHFKWLGLPMIQFPADVMALQEIIWDVRPDLIIETGIARGGSLIFYASMLELLGGDGHVIGIDIDIREPNRRAIEAHPLFHRIDLLEGSSVSDEIVREVHRRAANAERVLVVLDSNHTHAHSLAELQLYSPLVRAGSYLIALDTIIDEMPPGFSSDRPWGPGNNPRTAVHEFLKSNDRFEIDRTIPARLQITVAPDGYLKCVCDPVARKYFIASSTHARPDPSERIPLAGPSITASEIACVTDAVTNCWNERANDFHDRFESAFASFVERKHAVALPSCTSAIHLALAALGVGPGDEVIVPDVTWIASAAPVQYVGAQPVFADIDEQSWCLSAESFEACITNRTKAVIVVDLYGSMPDMNAILRVARRHDIAVIEDAAEAFGATFCSRPAGSFGEAGVFSFHGSKTLTTGEGGMLVTDRDDILERVLFLRDHGREPGDVRFLNREVAFKYRMSSLQAALGYAQLQRAEELISRKREIFAWYFDELRDVPGLRLNPQPDGVESSFWMVTVVLNPQFGLTKEKLATELNEHGFDTRPFFYPLSSIPAFRATPGAKAARRRNTVAGGISPYGINLPCGMYLTREQVSRVCRTLRDVLAQRRDSFVDNAA